MRETEPNSSILTADEYSFGTTTRGQTYSVEDVDYYKFSVANAGDVILTFGNSQATNAIHDVFIVDDSGNVLAGDAISGSGEIQATISSSGDYFIKVGNSTDTEDYTINASFQSSTSPRETEPNDNTVSADAMVFGSPIIGQTSSYSDDDYFALTVNEAGTVSVAYSGNGADYYYHSVSLIDSNGNILAAERFNDSGTLNAEISQQATYYILVNDSFDTEDYTLTATYSSITGSRETESNDARSTADTITSGVAITGQAASSTDIDYYKLALSSAGTISVSFNDGDGSQWYGHDVSIVNENGDILASQSIYETGVVSTEVASSGNYYVAVYDSFDTEDYTLTATYSSITGSRETESNDARSTADTITSGVAITGQAASSTDIDYYKLALSSAGTISVSFNDGDGSQWSDHDVSIVNENGDILASQSIYETGVVSTEVASSGNYYVAVYDSFDTEDYTLTATYSSITGSRETESNDARSTADTIASGVAITGQAASSTDIDYYKLALSSAGTISVSFNDGDGSQWYGHDVSIVNENGDILASQSIYETGVVSTEVASSGNYYVAVYDSFDTEDYTLTATYSSITGSRETESNDARSTADTITSGVAITGQAASSTDIDYYKLALSSAGTISVSFNDGDGSQWYSP